MGGALRSVLILYLLVFFSLLAAFIYIIYLSDQTSKDPKALQEASSSILSIIEIVAGAVVGSLSTAIAFTFKKDKGDE